MNTNIKKLSKEEIDANKEKFIDLIYQIRREGFDVTAFVDYLLKSDFFFAPASTKYHNAYYGGLCEHSLNVFYNLREINYAYNLNLDYTSMLIVGLLHDMAKVGFYDVYLQNNKVYKPNGKQRDHLGNYDWESTEAFNIIDSLDRATYGKHGFNSYMFIKDFINLKNEEIVALVHHHAGMGEYNPGSEMTTLLNQYPLLTALHLADMISTYIIEVNRDGIKNE